MFDYMQEGRKAERMIIEGMHENDGLPHLRFHTLIY